MNKPPSYITSSSDIGVSPDKLRVIRAMAERVRLLEADISHQENLLKDLRRSFNDLIYRELPELMEEAGLDHIGLPATADHPPLDLRLTPYYRANIAADWPPERRAEAFDWLDRHGHGDLIKTVVEVPFPREQREEVQRLKSILEDAGLSSITKEAVSHQTLTAWLREQIEGGNPFPPLDTLGATVGKVVKIKERK